MSPVIVWSIILLLLVALAYYITRLAAIRENESERYDAGLAILEFGRAFPKEAIRSLHATASGDAIFVRLHDNKAGIMKRRHNHYACHLVEPGRVRVMPAANAKGFTAEFLDAPIQNGTFVFASEKEAAEVSLWLLDNYVSVNDRQMDAASAASEPSVSPDQAN